MNLLARFKRGMQKSRDLIVNGVNRITAATVRFDADMLEELEALMVQADFGLPASTEILKRLEAAVKESGQTERTAVLAQLKAIWLDMLSQAEPLVISKGQLNIILLVGVNGTGKTTTAGKLCHRYQGQGLKVILAAADTFRAAAIEQLRHWGEITATPVISHQIGADPASVVFDALQSAQARDADVLIIDTAGRLHSKKNLMEELKKIHRIILRQAPKARLETILVIDATTGQNAVQQAKAFHEATDLTGLAITKLDGNAKGGVAVAVAHQTGTPLKLAGLGETVDDLVDFDPKAFVDALLAIEE